ncbi:single-stranded DNA-binding protein [Helicovermis profundi]|uniref:Single-stranded DNA-binding protein n=1 Tax=Helicovermis profundi TaxID=3065157 RepID=A0AAU9EC37_9FIRM|nr:single-stranded DNA-binding protein [Clostridia bacterium S502]
MNSVVLIGRLTRDPELRFVAGSGRAVANFTLAVNKNLSKEKKREFEEKGTPTADFIRIVVWGKQAENCANFLAKGRLVAVNGSISTSSYKTNTGETRYSTDVLANNVEFLEWGDKKAAPVKKDEFSYGAEPDNFQAVEDDDDIPF